jgi:hypothetical protein
VKLVETIKGKYNAWKDRRFLRKHGCENWKQYHYRFDPDIWKVATEIKNYYRGYPYIYCFENHNHDVYYWDPAVDGMYVLTEWCKKNCKDKFRFDFHRAMNAPGTAWEWHINELGGGDYIFAAFKDKRDFNWFLLRWS